MMPGMIQEKYKVIYQGLVVSRPVMLALMVLGIATVFSDAMSQTPNEGSISSAVDCTEITINYTLDGTLTREEAISRMDQAFFESLNQFDACHTSLSNSASASGNAGGAGGAAGAGQGASGDGDGSGGSGGSASMAGASRSVASPNLSGTDKAVSDSSITATAKTQASIVSKAMDKLHVKGKTGDLPVGSGKIPEDIPSADNDSVLEAQIRQAAMNETDPATKERLWREYRKYKGLPQPAEQKNVPSGE